MTSRAFTFSRASTCGVLLGRFGGQLVELRKFIGDVVPRRLVRDEYMQLWFLARIVVQCAEG
jgi:hypothetical protein